MSVRCVEHVEHTPFQRRSWAYGCILRIRLHTANVPREDNVILQRAVTTVITFTSKSTCDGRRESAGTNKLHNGKLACCAVRFRAGLGAAAFLYGRTILAGAERLLARNEACMSITRGTVIGARDKASQVDDQDLLKKLTSIFHLLHSALAPFLASRDDILRLRRHQRPSMPSCHSRMLPHAPSTEPYWLLILLA